MCFSYNINNNLNISDWFLTKLWHITCISFLPVSCIRLYWVLFSLNRPEFNIMRISDTYWKYRNQNYEIWKENFSELSDRSVEMVCEKISQGTERSFRSSLSPELHYLHNTVFLQWTTAALSLFLHLRLMFISVLSNIRSSLILVMVMTPDLRMGSSFSCKIIWICKR